MLQISFIRFVIGMTTKIMRKDLAQFVDSVPNSLNIWNVDVDNDFSTTVVYFSARNEEDAEKFVSLLKAHFED